MSKAFQCDACGSVVDDAPPNHYGWSVMYEAKRKDGARGGAYQLKANFDLTTRKEWSLFRGKDDLVQLCGPCLADGLEFMVERLRDSHRWRSTILVDRRAERLELDADGRAQFLTP